MMYFCRLPPDSDRGQRAGPGACDGEALDDLHGEAAGVARC